jgi:hypothetical protein
MPADLELRQINIWNGGAITTRGPERPSLGAITRIKLAAEYPLASRNDAEQSSEWPLARAIK